MRIFQRPRYIHTLIRTGSGAFIKSFIHVHKIFRLKGKEMNIKSITLAIVFIMNVGVPIIHADTNENASKPTQPIPKVKTASFILDDGKTVYGLVHNDDRTMITISEVRSNIIVLTTYLKSEIDSRITYKLIPEPEYWETTAGYFLKRSWDFKDDPDDFTQALRCCRKALEIYTQYLGESHEKVAETKAKIKSIENEQEQWIKQATTRAELKKLELQSAINERMDEIFTLISQNAESIQSLREISKEIQLLRTDIFKEIDNVYDALQRVEYKVDDNTTDIRDLYERVRNRDHRRYYYYRTP